MTYTRCMYIHSSICDTTVARINVVHMLLYIVVHVHVR